MRSVIDKLEEEIWAACVRERTAEDQETTDRWQTDEYSHLRERFSVRPMPSELDKLASDALVQWQQIENKVCATLGMSREQLLNKFAKARESYLNKGTEWQMTIVEMQFALSGVVRNLDWVNLFSWILPVADKEHADKYRATGRMITAIFYIELLFKNGDDCNDRELKRIEARWRIVNQT